MTERRFCLVFGTSAAPIHLGHNELIVKAALALENRGYKVARVVILPVYWRHNISDEAKKSLQASYEDRLALCQLAAEEIAAQIDRPSEWVEVSRLEEALSLLSGQPNYTVETLEVMSGELEENERLAFLLGADSVSGASPRLGHWYRLDDLLHLTSFVIGPRDGFPPNLKFIQKLSRQGAEVIYLDEVDTADISSSTIRETLTNTNDPKKVVRAGWLSPQALNYILDHNMIEQWQNRV